MSLFSGCGTVSSVTIMNCIPIDALTLRYQPLKEFHAKTTRQAYHIIYFCFAILKRKTTHGISLCIMLFMSGFWGEQLGNTSFYRS